MGDELEAIIDGFSFNRDIRFKKGATKIVSQTHNENCIFLGHIMYNVKDWKLKTDVKDRVIQKGSSHGMSKLTEDDVLSIRSGDEPGTELAKRYGVCCATISNIRNRVSWTHI